MNIATIMPQLQRAQAMLQAGQAAQAWLLLAPLRPAIDGHGQALRLYALVAQEVGRTDDAIDALLRIAALEGSPADILGAIADTYDRAGRHEDAYAAWSGLVANHPQIADAHLNRSIAAANAGWHDMAIAAADAGLKHFPDQGRLLASKAMALKNAGRIPESVELFERAVAADPTRALTRHNQAVALRAACRYAEACDAFEASEKLGMKGARFHANWAAAALEAGEVDRAADLYRKALEEDPAHGESLRGLTRLQIEYRDGEDAFSHYGALVAQRPEPGSWVDWMNALASNKRYDAVAELGERALAQFPGNSRILALTTFAKGISGDAAEALHAMGSLPAQELDMQGTMIARAELGLRAGRPELTAELAERMTRRDPRNQIAWSLLSVAWRLLDDKREHWLCDYDRLVMETEVPSPDGALDPADYARRVASALDPLHQTLAAPGNQSLRQGTQTSGMLFDRPDPAIQEFRQAVLMAAGKALARLPKSEDHPFLGRLSDQLGFSGSWSVRLQAGGGHHVPHFHVLGWMSSAYYARIPDVDDAARERHEGWIQFGEPPAMFDLDLPPRRIVEPKPGKLVLFPSYMWHGTMPFHSGDRLTAAFDYVPL